MPRISHGELLLTGALTDLRRDWDTASADWDDAARERFEVEFIREVEPAARGAIRALTELSELMKRVVRECS